MTLDSSSTTYKSKLLADFIVKHHARLDSDMHRPLMVSMQGPQGCGKSTLAAALVSELASRQLNTAVASLDDFYLPYEGLKALAAAHPENTSLAGRGPPGTHDIPLLSSALSSIRTINGESTVVELPIFDKSLNGGYGDRSTLTVRVSGPIQVFLLEGWSLGFEPSSSTTLESFWRKGRVAQTHPLESMIQINDNLSAFSTAIHKYFDIHIAIRPTLYDYVYTWRLEQEHHMKRLNGGKGMSDEEVEKFVDRYMPCYELYGDQEVQRKGIVLKFGEKREVKSVKETQAQ